MGNLTAKINLTELIDLYVEVTSVFTDNDTYGDGFVAYDPVHVTEGPKKFDLREQDSLYYITDESKTIARLGKDSLNNSLFVIEFAFEATNVNRSYVDYTFGRSSEEPTYKNDTSIEFESIEFVNGRYRLIANFSDTFESNILMTLTRREIQTNYFMKYYTVKSTTDIHSCSYNKTVTASKRRNVINISFNPIETSSECAYIIAIYHKKDITDTNINTIYNSSIAIFSDKITKTQTSITLNTDDYEVYVTVIGVISIGENKEERVVYDFVEPIELPKKYDIKTEKEYVNDKLSSLDMKNTYRLKKRTTNSSLFEIEISDGINVKQTTYSIDIALELYYDTPTYANDTHFKFISDIVSKGKRIALVKCDDAKEEEIMISFFVKENKETNENITLDYIFKYRSVKEVSEIKTYEFDHSFTSSIFFSTLTVSFTEIFAKNQTDIVESSNYYIIIYNSNNVSAISTLESIDIYNHKQNAMTTDTFKGNNKERNMN